MKSASARWPAACEAGPRMPASDRLFRALARDEPEVVVRLLRRLVPRVVPAGAVITPVDVLDPNLDLLFTRMEVDWLGHLAPDTLLQVDCQGYRDATFPDRLFRYSLGVSLRFPGKKVRSVGIWLRKPNARERLDVIQYGGITVRATMVAVPEVPAERLLGDPMTACFAPAADAGGMEDEVLIARTGEVLQKMKASPRQWAMAAAAAAVAGRSGTMLATFWKTEEDKVLLAELKQLFREQAELQGMRRALRRVLTRRALVIAPDDDLRIRYCDEPDQIERWLDAALVATSTAEALR